MKKIALVFGVIFILCGEGRTWSFELIGFEGRYDVILHINTDTDSAPSPLIGTVGGAAWFSVMDWLKFAPGLSVYSNDYFFNGTRALPAEIEYKDAVTILGFMIEAPAIAEFKVAEKVSLSGGLGPLFMIRIPFVPHGANPTADVMKYYYGNGRFLFLENREGVDIELTDNWGIAIRVRVLLPIFHLWDGENLPFQDQMGVGAGIGIRYLFK
jgi:hypothetical protein